MELLDQYEDSLQAIHDYFDYEEDWSVIPIDDRREYYWYHKPDSEFQSEKSSGIVAFSENRSNLIKYVVGSGDEDGMDIYQDAIYTQRHLKKYVYVGEEYTMISVDTQTDGNKFLAIFSNEKQVTISRLDTSA